MSKANVYRWPVIAGIIVGGLILFSVIACAIRCCCCGMSCCCTCFSFLKCCDCCGGACDGKKDKPHKHLDDPHAHHNYPAPTFAPTSGYQAPSAMPMMGGGLAAKPAAPQYAQFEVGSNGLAVTPKPLSEDALPPMPSWETATKKHVETEEDKNAVELSNLTPTNGQNVPLMAGGVAAGHSMPASPNFDPSPNAYGGRGQANAGYMGVGAADQYGQSQSTFNTGYGAQTTGSTRGYASSPPQDAYGQNTNFVAAAVPGGYQRPQRQNTGDRQYQNQNMNQYPPQQNQYSGNPRHLDRQYSDHPENHNQAPRDPSRGPNRMASPPNNQGFDFAPNNQPYSRPAQNQQPSYNSARSQQTNDSYYNGSTAAPSYASRSPPIQDSYQSYQAPSNGRAPGRDPRQQPKGWDPVNR